MITRAPFQGLETSTLARARAVYLDRDGVLVRSDVRDGKPFAVAKARDMEVFAEAPAAVASLKALGFVTIVATNQPDIATGKLEQAELDAMHRTLAGRMALDDILICPHADADQCECRKPKPGLLREAARRHNIDLKTSFVVGDRWRDVEAGRSAGCITIFVDRGYREKLRGPADHMVADVGEAANVIARLTRADSGDGR
jgi:D-glycero-D-manno-heptose 1,7-bisphosphate phosphatase